MKPPANIDFPAWANAHRRERAFIAAGLAAMLSLLALSAGILKPLEAAAAPPANAASGPNVVLFLTDDQTLEEMRALPYTSALMAGGVNFRRAYVSYPLCCPSRATLLSGQFMHNNGVRGNNGPFGGWQRFHNLGTEANALPTWLQDAGYYNVHVGKYMNGYGGGVPPGWDEWYGKLSEYNESVYGAGIYFNYRLFEDPPDDGGLGCPTGNPAPKGAPFNCFYSGLYQTDVLRDKAMEAVNRLGGAANPPFFLSVGFNAPHSPYIPAPRHQDAYLSAPLAKLKGTNERDVSDKPGFLRKLPRLGKGKLKQISTRRRSRLAMLRSVDEAVASIVLALQAENELQNTYLIFTSDNGYWSGEHRVRQGKYLPHEPSSHVPLMIRGPGIPSGTSNELVSNVDLAETIRDIAGAPARLIQDGRSLLPFAANPGLRSSRPILLEAETGPSVDDEGAESPKLLKAKRKAKRRRAALKRRLRQCDKLGDKQQRKLCRLRGVRNLEQEPGLVYKLRAPAYRALRTDRYLFVLYATGETELYDMRRDPHQLRSVNKERRYRPVRKWFFDRLAEFSNCAGASCRADVGTEPAPRKSKSGKKKKG
jgi:N-acetylglucosamine-6-sulfatase